MEKIIRKILTDNFSYLKLENVSFLYNTNTFAPIAILKFKDVDKKIKIKFCYTHTHDDFEKIINTHSIDLINILRIQKLKKINGIINTSY